MRHTRLVDFIRLISHRPVLAYLCIALTSLSLLPSLAIAADIVDITLSGRNNLYRGSCNKISVVINRTSAEMAPARLSKSITVPVKLRIQYPNGGTGNYDKEIKILPYRPVFNAIFRSIRIRQSGNFRLSSYIGTRISHSEAFDSRGYCLPDYSLSSIECAKDSSLTDNCRVHYIASRGIEPLHSNAIYLEVYDPAENSRDLYKSGTGAYTCKRCLTSLKIRYPRAGIYVLRATIDPNELVVERNERNNRATVNRTIN